MSRHVFSIFVQNHAGVLSRISGLFSRRGYNIESLSVGVTEDPEFSRITIVSSGDEYIIGQIKKQVQKLEEVKKITILESQKAVFRELTLIKVSVSAEKRSEVMGVVEIFRANIIDVSPTSLTVEITGDQNKLNAFMQLLEPYGILEVARTGLTALGRGADVLRDMEE